MRLAIAHVTDDEQFRRLVTAYEALEAAVLQVEPVEPCSGARKAEAFRDAFEAIEAAFSDALASMAVPAVLLGGDVYLKPD